MTMIDQANAVIWPYGPSRLMTVGEVSQLAGLGESTVWEMSRDGRLPKPVKLGARVTRWVSTEIEEWLQGLMAARV